MSWPQSAGRTGEQAEGAFRLLLISYPGAAENIVAADCPRVWFGEIDAPFWTPLFIMNGRNTLELLCQPHDKNVTLGFCGNDFSVALRMYAKGNGGRMADARGRRWVKIAAAAMNNDWLVLSARRRHSDEKAEVPG